tara:strand:+ start:219 stop:878 length:660 start_codon:yes stop_codon:yes gene_type:complete
MIIFDCDGVLVDSEILSCETDAQLMSEAGYPITTEELIHEFIGRPKPAIWAELEKRRGTPWPDGLLDRASDVLQMRLETELLPVEGIAEALGRLDGPRAVASSSGVMKLALSLDVCGLSGFFGDHVYSAELVARGKPAPDVFLLAACKVGTDPADCLVIEDSAAGITAARRAGMRAIGFTGGRHSWPAHRSVLEEAGAIDILTHMRDLPDTIEKNLRAT